MTRFKKGDVVKIVDAIGYERFIMNNDLLKVVRTRASGGACGYCANLGDKCQQIDLGNLNEEYLCGGCSKRAVRATKREWLLYYIYGQSALQGEQNEKSEV